MGDLHEIDIRMKCIIQVVHHILVVLMKYSTKHHGDCRTKTDLNIGFAEIFTSNETYVKRAKKGLLKDYYKDYFYDPVTGALRTSVIIEKLDFLVICMILQAKSKLSSLETKQCCSACHHYCTTCGPTGANCKRSVECVFNSCTCGCDYENLVHFIIVSKALRNTNAHTPYQRYVDFENGKLFSNFSSCNTWRDIWEMVNDACIDCLKFLVKVKAIDLEEFKDQEMNLRIGLKKEQNFLLPIVGSFIKQYHMIILGEEDVSKKISKIEQSILNNNKLLSMEYVYLGGKLVCFEDAVVKTSLKIESIKAQGVEFVVTFIDKIGEIVLQTKSFGSSWYFHPKQSFQWKIVGNDLMIDIFELNPDLTYDFRLLGVKEDGTLFSFSYTDFNLKSMESERFISSQSLLIDKDIRIELYQKTDRGLVIFLPEPMPNIVTVQTNIDSKWKDLEVNQYSLNENNKLELELCNLECRNQHIRCIVEQKTTDQTQTISYTLNNVDVVGRKHLYHITNNGSIVAIMHGYGAPDDVHQNISNIQHLTKPKLLSTEYQNGGGAITHSIAEADDYLSTNFPDQQAVIFPPFFSDSSNYVNKLVGYLEKTYKTSYDSKRRVIVILDESNSNQIHERTTEEDFVTDQTKFCNTVVVFDGSLNLILFITCSEATDIGGLYNDHACLHNVMKSFVNYSSDLFLKNHQKQPVGLVGVLATLKLNREQLNEMNFCRSEGQLCCKMFLTTTEMEKQESFGHWYEKISRKVVEEYRNRGISLVKLTDSFYCFANRLMVLLAIYDVNLPSAFGSPDTKIRTLLLNEEQMRAVDSPSKWKLITGPYGCGKTIVGQRILEKIIRQLNPETDIIYYIVFDEYSLLQNEMEKFCKNLQETYGVPIICCDINQICETRVLSDCLSETASRYLHQTKHSIFLAGKEQEYGKPTNVDPGQTLELQSNSLYKKVHLFIDEYDSEKLTESESRRINFNLQVSFKECFVVLVTQSIQKKRSYVSEEEIKILSNCIDILGETMETVILTKVMRFTNDILQTSEAIQETLASIVNSYSQPSFITIDVSSSSTNNKKNRRSENDENAQTTKQSEDSVDGNVDDVDSTDGIGHRYLAILNTRNVTLDRLLKITSSYTNLQCNDSLSMKTEFQFYQSTGCGHEIIGHKPSVVRFQENNINFASIANAIVELVDPKWKKSLYICTDLKIAHVVYDALSALGVQVIDYLDGLLNVKPLYSRKQDVYSRWLNAAECVLLTDNRGCRGLQHEQVVLLLDENEYYERFLLPEMIGRATSNLTLFTFNFESSPSRKSGINKRNDNITIGKFVDLLLDKDLLKLHYIESLPTLTNLYQAEGGSTFDREIEFTWSQCSEAWEDVLVGPTQFGRLESSSLKIFIGMKKLAHFLVNRRIGREKARPDTPEEKLYKVCENVISENSDVFRKVVDAILPDDNRSSYLGNFKSLVNKVFGLDESRNSGRIVSVFAFCMAVCETMYNKDFLSINLDLMIEQIARGLAANEWISTSEFWREYVGSSRPVSQVLKENINASIGVILSSLRNIYKIW